MATTSDERRDVAENLRYMAMSHSIEYKEQFFDDLADEVVGFENPQSFDEVLESLADLIDPTCRMRLRCPAKYPDRAESAFVCSRCGWRTGVQHAAMLDADDFPFRCCPNCGARVVESHE